MGERWAVLAALTLARVSMGAQFQSVPALGPELRAAAGLGAAGLGTLVGAYLLPGAAAALAGGWLGQRLGDIRVAAGGLALMALGGAAGAVSAGFEAMLAARLVAGIGAVGLNVMLTKMAIDWFAGRAELSTALGVLVASWPAGIALAMVTLPSLALAAGTEAALAAPAALCAASAGLLLAVWRRPEGAAAPAGPGGVWPRGAELRGVLHAGLIWGAYNLGLILLLAFGPALLIARGAGPVGAAAATSLVTWAAIVSVAGGGWLAARTGRPDALSHAAFWGAAALAAGFALGGPAGAHPAALAAIGLAMGPAAGVIMTLPAEAARPEARATAMGIYSAVYYAMMAVGPPVAGALRDATGAPAAPVWAAVGLLAGCSLLFALFRARAGRGAAAG